MTGPGDVWPSFTRDPRRPEHASLRASDADREVVHQVLTEAYADGRLDRDEFDTRSSEVVTARTLGDLPAIVEGLIPTSEVATVRPGSDLMSDTQLDERAVAAWANDRREALWGFIAASLICWTIWFATGGSFPWPLFVMLGTGLNVGRKQFHRDELIASERRRLEKKQRKKLEQRPPEDET